MSDISGCQPVSDTSGHKPHGEASSPINIDVNHKRDSSYDSSVDVEESTALLPSNDQQGGCTQENPRAMYHLMVSYALAAWAWR